jgi:hypothetical protein
MFNVTGYISQGQHVVRRGNVFVFNVTFNKIINGRRLHKLEKLVSYIPFVNLANKIIIN